MGFDRYEHCGLVKQGMVDVKAVKLEHNVDEVAMPRKENNRVELNEHQRLIIQSRRPEFDENRSPNILSNGQSSSSVLDQGQSPADDTGVSSSSLTCPAPLCRQFWRAGDYDGGAASKVTFQNNKNHLHVHPMFLHSNATSHKWAFGAIAELVDNAVDEINNGATYVIVDKTSNPRDGSRALLILDDGGGMDPESMRRCMSFGFSDKKSKSAIGQYGNGFKTSTMRLGADVVVFSRHLDNRTLTQSIGLLSYTFLTQTCHDRIVVPMIDYTFNASTGGFEMLHGRETSNLSMLLQWSPFSTEADLLKQFEDIGTHGTKVIIYNLWFIDEGNTELDFDTDPEDIRISGDCKRVDTLPAWKTVNEQHIANRLRYSLREYLSILYLRIPPSFKIVLCGRVVEHHNLANDLKFPEFILYRPQSGGSLEGTVITTIGFLKEAPQVTIHGFNVYHKNRLIVPFWQVLRSSNSRGRGVVGVLEANFIEPTHNKQDFERTSVFQKLEGRLKEMTCEYWDYHCGLIGYHVTKKTRTPLTPEASFPTTAHGGIQQPVILSQSSLANTKAAVGRAEHSIHNSQSCSRRGLSMKRKEHVDLTKEENVKRRAGEEANKFDTGSRDIQPLHTIEPKNQEAMNLLKENKNLRLKCLEYEKSEEELTLKVTELENEIKEVQSEYSVLLAELESLDAVKGE